jgi:hypothetical protein
MIEEALIDAQKLKELAVENARRDIIEKITPRIKELVESRMMEDSSAEDSGGTSELDEDDEVTTESGDYEMSSESLKTMAPILRAAGDQNSKLELSVANLGESVQRALRVSDTKRQESEFISGISQLFSTIQDIYSHVHESRTLTTTRKAALEQKLESHFAELNEGFKEISMKKLSLREADEMLDAGAPDAGAAPAPGAEDAQEGPEGEDVVITLKGLNGVDAESLNVEVEVESPDEEEGEEGGADLPAAPDADGGGDDVFGEGEELSGDTILEISDVELKKEIARMRRLSEGDEDVGKYGHSLLFDVRKPLEISDLAQGNRNLIVGEPGIGKTELLKKFKEHHDALGDKTHLINLRVGNSSKQIDDFLAEASPLRKVLLLDALDETSSAIFPEVLKKLEEVSKNNSVSY